MAYTSICSNYWNRASTCYTMYLDLPFSFKSWPCFTLYLKLFPSYVRFCLLPI